MARGSIIDLDTINTLDSTIFIDVYSQATSGGTRMYDHTQVSFKAFYHTESPNNVVAVLGSPTCLGYWNPAKPLILAEDVETGAWSAKTRLQVGGSFEWKLAILDHRYEIIVHWEDVPNRVLSVGKLPLSVADQWSGALQVNTLQPSVTDTSNTTGGALGSLQSTSSCHCIGLNPGVVTVVFKIRFIPRADHEAVAVLGSNTSFGSWNPERAIVCEQFGTENCWVGSVTLSTNATYEWKMVCLHKRNRRILRWEDNRNRRLCVEQYPLEVLAPWNIKEIIRYSKTPSIEMSPLERKSSDVDCSNGLSTNNNNNSDGNRPLCVNFIVDYDATSSDIVLCVVGSCETLGNWKLENALFLRQQQHNSSKWQGTIFSAPQSTIEWKLLMLHKGVDIWEPHCNRRLKLEGSGVDVFVTWNRDEQVELVPSSLNDFVQVTFKTRYKLEDDEMIVVCGSSGNLGAWDVKESLVLDNQHSENCWNSKQVFVVGEVVECKLAVVDAYTGKAKKWEAYPNRVLYIGQSSLEVILPWGSKEIIREVYPKRGEPGAKTMVRSTCLQQIFSCCCTEEESDPVRDGTEQNQNIVNKYEPSSQRTVNALFETKYAPTNENHVLAISGSCDSLGNWDIGKTLEFERGPEDGSWQVITSLPINVPIEWKMVVKFKGRHRVIHWEDGDNRLMKVKRAGVEIVACWNSLASVKPAEGRYIAFSSWSSENDQCSRACEDELVTATFKAQCCCDDSCHMAVIGSAEGLGYWRPEYAALMEPRDGGEVWETTVRLPLNTDIHWKMILMEKRTSRVVKWEDHDDRVLRIRQSDLRIEALWNEQEKTSNADLGEACGTETQDPELKSVIKTASTQLKEKKSVHFPIDPVADCRVYVKNKSMTQRVLQRRSHTDFGCDGNNNSLVVQCCISYIVILFVCLAAIQFV